MMDQQVAQFTRYFEQTWFNEHYHLSEWCGYMMKKVQEQTITLRDGTTS